MQRLMVLVGLVLLAWLIEVVDFIVPGRWLDSHGIVPRTLFGLEGILFAPFLHAGFAHLAANTVPFLTLGFLVILRGLATFVGVTLSVMLLGGLGVWVFGPGNTVTIGASGVIFGYIGYLLGRGYFERRLDAILIALVVAVVYGGALWGVLPGDPRISWQGHLFSFLAGVATAWMLQGSRASARAVPSRL